MKIFIAALTGFCLITQIGVAQEKTIYRAARSVHPGYQTSERDAFYLEMTVLKSRPGSYFMACGWGSGYFGIEELGNGRKAAIFSVWDLTADWNVPEDPPGEIKK